MSKSKIRRIVCALAACTMLATAFAGCSDGGAGSPGGSTGGTADAGGDSGGGDGAISGKIVVGGWPSGDAAFKAAEAGFKALYPDVEVEYQFTDTDAYRQSLQTALAAGSEAPDVAMVEGAWIGQYANSPVLENLLDAPYNAGEFADDFVSLKWNQSFSLDGTRLIGLPWDIGPCTLFYRRDVFDDAGLPSDPEEVSELLSTWEGVLQAAEAVHIPGQRWLYPNATYFYTLMFMNRDYFNEDLTVRMERDGDIEALQAALTMRENGWDANVPDMWAAEAYAGFADGSIASVASGAWFGGFLKVDIDPDGEGNWGVVELPGGIPAANWGGSFLVLPSQSSNKEPAWAYIKYMMTDATAQNTMFEAVDYYPAYIPAWSDTAIYEAEDPYFGGQKTKALWVDIANAFPNEVFTTVSDSNAEGAIYNTVNAGLQAGKDPQTIIEEAKAAIEVACAETNEQQKQNMIDAGIWND